MTARIRLVNDSDAEAIARIYRPAVEDTTISFETVAPDREEIVRRIADTTQSHPWLVCELDGVVVGYAYASKHRVRAAYRWSVDTSVYVDATCRRCGIGRGLYVSLFSVLSAQGFFNAYAGIALPNPASVGLHESVGFRPIGVYQRVGYKLGAWQDVGWWQVFLKPHDASPGEPLSLVEVQRLPGWRTLLARGESVIRPSSG